MEEIMYGEEILDSAFESSKSILPELNTVIAAISTALTAFVIISLITAAVSLVFWALRAIGIFKMSEKEGIKNPWYSFIPFFDMIALGRLGAGYKKKNLSVTKDKSKVLLIIKIITSILGFASVLAFLGLVIKAGAVAFLSDTDDVTFSMIASAGWLVFIVFALSVLEIVYFVTYYICLYNIYLKFNRDNAVLFTVLGIFFSFLTPIFLYMSAKKEPVHSEEEFKVYQYNEMNKMFAAQKAAANAAYEPAPAPQEAPAPETSAPQEAAPEENNDNQE